MDALEKYNLKRQIEECTRRRSKAACLKQRRSTIVERVNYKAEVENLSCRKYPNNNDGISPFNAMDSAAFTFSPKAALTPAKNVQRECCDSTTDIVLEMMGSCRSKLDHSSLQGAIEVIDLTVDDAASDSVSSELSPRKAPVLDAVVCSSESEVDDRVQHWMQSDTLAESQSSTPKKQPDLPQAEASDSPDEPRSPAKACCWSPEARARFQPPLSPESAKTEFYSYLKINTKPLAQLVSVKDQKRRSNRVKKLHELEQRKRERLSHAEPSPLANFGPHTLNGAIFQQDFDEAIQQYFASEVIDAELVLRRRGEPAEQERKLEEKKMEKEKEKEKKLTEEKVEEKAPERKNGQLSKVLQEKKKKRKKQLLKRALQIKSVLPVSSYTMLRSLKRVTRRTSKGKLRLNLDVQTRKKKRHRLLKKLSEEADQPEFFGFSEECVRESEREIVENNSSLCCSGFEVDEMDLTEKLNMDTALVRLTRIMQLQDTDVEDNAEDDVEDNAEDNVDGSFEENVEDSFEENVEDIVLDNVVDNVEDEEFLDADEHLIHTSEIVSEIPAVIPFDPTQKMTPFHKCLTSQTPKLAKNVPAFECDQEAGPATLKLAPGQRKTHEICLEEENGPVCNAYYANHTLVLVQERTVSFWKQSSLGNLLGAQNMWIANGSVRKLSLERGCVNRKCSEMILCQDSAVAYIELWIKEHKSDKRERPVADVFAAVYFFAMGQGGPDKKVLQLENIKSFADDVQYTVTVNSRQIVVSWWDTFVKPMQTVVHNYCFAADFQTINSVREMKACPYYISSLHNIIDCDSLIMGFGDDRVTVWNLNEGYVVVSLNLLSTISDMAFSQVKTCLWARCDKGFLFLIQQIESDVLQLVAINGIAKDWKQLQTYRIPSCYSGLKGVACDSGILMTCHSNGFLCWDVMSGTLLAETDILPNQVVLSSHSYLISIENFKVSVQQVMFFLLTND